RSWTFGLRDHSIWRYNFADKTMTRLTSEGFAEGPIWTPDGIKVVFEMSLMGAYDLFPIRSDATESPKLLMEGGTMVNRLPQAWTPDGRSLGCYESGDIKVFSAGSDRKIRHLIATRFREMMADLSPDGLWITYVSNEGGRNEVDVQRFPE